MSGSVTIQGQITGTQVGSQFVGPFTCPASSSNEYETFPFTFTSFTGTTENGVPSWANGTILTFNVGATGTVRIGGANTDVGALISLTNPTLLNWEGTGATTYWLICAGFTGTGWVTNF